jgi:hypothetical protein
VEDVHPFVASLVQPQQSCVESVSTVKSPEDRRPSGQSDEILATPGGFGIANARGRLSITRSDATPAPESFSAAPRIPGRPVRPPQFNDGPSPRSRKPVNEKLQLYVTAFHKPEPPPASRRAAAPLSSVTHQNGSLASSQRPSRANSPAPTPPSSPTARQPASRRYRGRTSRIVTSSVFGSQAPHPILSPQSQFSVVSNTSSGSRPPPKPFPLQPTVKPADVGTSNNVPPSSSPQSQQSKLKQQPSPPQPHRPNSQLSAHSRQRRDSIFRVGGYRRPSSAVAVRSPPPSDDCSPSVPLEILHLVPGGSFTRYLFCNRSLSHCVLMIQARFRVVAQTGTKPYVVIPRFCTGPWKCVKNVVENSHQPLLLQSQLM